MQGIVALLDKSVRTKETRLLMGRLMRQTAQLRGHMNAADLQAFVSTYLPAGSKSGAYLEGFVKQVGGGGALWGGWPVGREGRRPPHWRCSAWLQEKREGWHAWWHVEVPCACTGNVGFFFTPPPTVFIQSPPPLFLTLPALPCPPALPSLQDAAEVPAAMEEDSSSTAAAAQDDGKSAAAAGELAARVRGLPEVELYLYLLLLIYLIDKQRYTQVGQGARDKGGRGSQGASDQGAVREQGSKARGKGGRAAGGVKVGQGMAGQGRA